MFKLFTRTNIRAQDTPMSSNSNGGSFISIVLYLANTARRPACRTVVLNVYRLSETLRFSGTCVIIIIIIVATHRSSTRWGQTKVCSLGGEILCRNQALRGTRVAGGATI